MITRDIFYLHTGYWDWAFRKINIDPSNIMQMEKMHRARLGFIVEKMEYDKIMKGKKVQQSRFMVTIYVSKCQLQTLKLSLSPQANCLSTKDKIQEYDYYKLVHSTQVWRYSHQ